MTLFRLNNRQTQSGVDKTTACSPSCGLIAQLVILRALRRRRRSHGLESVEPGPRDLTIDCAKHTVIDKKCYGKQIY